MKGQNPADPYPVVAGFSASTLVSGLDVTVTFPP
jgi:hypothetical protein